MQVFGGPRVPRSDPPPPGCRSPSRPPAARARWLSTLGSPDWRAARHLAAIGTGIGRDRAVSTMHNAPMACRMASPGLLCIRSVLSAPGLGCGAGGGVLSTQRRDGPETLRHTLATCTRPGAIDRRSPHQPPPIAATPRPPGAAPRRRALYSAHSTMRNYPRLRRLPEPTMANATRARSGAGVDAPCSIRAAILASVAKAPEAPRSMAGRSGARRRAPSRSKWFSVRQRSGTHGCARCARTPGKVPAACSRRS